MGLMGNESPAGYLRELWAFHEWRCGMVQSVMETLERPKWDEQLTGSFGSLIQLLNHLAWAEQVWFERIRNHPMPPRLNLEGPAIFETWQQANAQWRSRLADPELAPDQRFDFANSKGATYQMSLTEIVVHLVDHATYHVGQVMNGVRGLGGKPVSTNFIHYLRTQQKK